MCVRLTFLFASSFFSARGEKQFVWSVSYFFFAFLFHIQLKQQSDVFVED